MHQIEAFVINHWDLWLALVIVLFLIFINERVTQNKRPSMLSPAGLVELINHQNGLVIDIREQEIFRKGHIINAIRVSQDDLESEGLTQYKDKPIVLVCARGAQAETVASKLRTQGYAKVSVLDGGIAAWSAANMPLVKGK